MLEHWKEVRGLYLHGHTCQPSHMHISHDARGPRSLYDNRQKSWLHDVHVPCTLVILSVCLPPFITDQSSAARLSATVELTPCLHLLDSDWQLSHKVRPNKQIQECSSLYRTRKELKSYTRWNLTINWSSVKSESSMKLLFRVRSEGVCQADRKHCDLVY